MLPRSVKAAYFHLAAVPMRVNGALYRVLRAPRTGEPRVHLGPGQGKYLPGWINVDANMFTARCDVWADLRNALPFPDGTVSAIYSHHVIEHLPDASLPFHFRELTRCLLPGGRIRIGVPHVENGMKKYLESDPSWFGDFPDKRSSVGGRFANFALCRGEHLTLLTPSYLEELATAAGFERFAVCAPVTETNHPDFFDGAVLGLEEETDIETPHTLVIEACRPNQ